jgi:DNA-binding NarL/FixJ family response regulator
MIQILVVDDHDVVRGLMCDALNAEPGMQVVGDLNSGEAALRAIPALKPDVVILDIGLPGMDGIETAGTLRAKGFEMAILCLTMHLSEPIKERAFAAGVTGYAVKHDPFETLVDAIQTVTAGERFVSPALGNAEDTGAADLLRRLSKRELEIVSHVASGWTAAEIADFLKISERTVDFHRRSIAEKTGLRRIADITKFAMEIGLRADD